MRALWTTLAAAWFFALAPLVAEADVTVKQLMGFRPSFKGVDYEVPTDPAAIAACKAETVPGGFQLRDGQGKILCRLVDRNGDGKLDQWSYYQDGFEVYRELDNNGDKSLDEVRWMNSGGTRAAKVVGGKVAAWTRLSAEEASKVFVQALVSGDSELLESVMASPAELEPLGIPKGEIEQVAAAEKQRVAQVKAIRSGLVGWDANTTWLGLERRHAAPDPVRLGAQGGHHPLRERDHLRGLALQPGQSRQGRLPPGRRDDPPGRDLEVRRPAQGR